MRIPLMLDEAGSETSAQTVAGQLSVVQFFGRGLASFRKLGLPDVFQFFSNAPLSLPTLVLMQK
jgi:hypothetical protein